MPKEIYTGMLEDDTCIICGEYTPEGTQVCIKCQKEAEKD